MAQDTTGRVSGLFTYPMKGFTPQALDTANLNPGGTMPWDRAWALENGPSGFDPQDPQHLPKINFFVLMAHPALARFTTHVDLNSGRLTVRRDGALCLNASLVEPAGRHLIESFFAAALHSEARGPVRLVTAPQHSFSDIGENVLHIVNLASVRALETALEHPIDPARFRANILIDGFPAWTERDWIGRTLQIGPVQLTVQDRTGRCAATNANPAKGIRDMTIPDDLDRLYGHRDFGIYAAVASAGSVAIDAPVAVLPAAPHAAG